MTFEHSADGMILCGGEGGGRAIQSSHLLFCNGLLSVDADAVRILMAVITSVTVDCSMHAYRCMYLYMTDVPQKLPSMVGVDASLKGNVRTGTGKTELHL
jgi:hypothetical protein